jgi:sugar transferase (PEP-CTERM system associated)
MVRLFSHWFPSNTILHVVLDTLLLFLSVVLAALWFYHGDVPGMEVVIPSALLFALTMVVLNTALGLYRGNCRRTRAQTMARVFTSWLLALPVAYGIFEGLPWGEFRLEALKLASLLALSVLVVVRGLAAHGGTAPMLVRRVLVLGTGTEAADVEQSLKQFGSGVRIVGFLGVSNGDPSHVAAERILPSGSSLADTVLRNQVDEVVVAVRERRGSGLPLNDLLACKLAGVRVLDVSSYYERATGQVRLDSLRASWLIFGEGFRQGTVRVVMKRLFDIVFSLLLLLLASPTMIITAVLIVLESGFPVLYRQERVGQGGRVFRVLKFRSMRTDAERDGKPRWAASNDDRVTRVGRVIRKLRIDELPQLFNVLKGDMSLVGPRPERPFFVDQLSGEIPFYAARHSVKPGVTGWAQVRYHYGSTVEDAVQKLQYDLYYVKNHSLFLDLVVLFETVGVVLTGAGAQ